jgi:hypothetical protein
MKTLLLALALVTPAFSQNAPDPHTIPAIDGAIGPCSADFTITDPVGSPVYLAQITVHIAYGFGSFHKLDLQVSTNIDGKARFTGLPARLKHQLLFHVSDSQNRTQVAYDDPAQTCHQQFNLALEPAPPK